MTYSTVRANGLEFAYLSRGTGPLVLLLHGFPDTAESWTESLQALEGAGFWAVAPNLRGYSPTEVPADGRYDIDTLGDDVIALIRALGRDRAIVVGNDWGAVAGYAAASCAPELIDTLVTIAIPHARAVVPTPWLAWKARHFAALRRRGAATRVRANDFAYVDELLRRWSPEWSFSRAETTAVKRAFADERSLDAALGYYRALRVIVPRSLRKRTPVPCVSFCGDSDPFFRPKVYKRARTLFADSYEAVTLPGGHFLHREHPELFNRELIRRLTIHD